MRRLIDKPNMSASTHSSNAPAGMPAMRAVRGRSAWLTHFVAAGCIARDGLYRLERSRQRSPEIAAGAEGNVVDAPE